jgi:hypothetical protein
MQLNPLVFLVVLTLAAGVAARAATADEIIDRAVARAERQHRTLAANEYELIERTVVNSLDGDGEITKTETEVARVYEVEGARFEELVQADGRPLD